jgi:SAM-dependent methyltransferase
MDKQIVHRIEDGMDRQQVMCTTYQMRNFYKQFGDGFFSVLDVMNYIQHHQVVKWCGKGDRVLDVCCGRGLILPMLRYQRKEIAGYVGVDINESMREQVTGKRVTDGKPFEEGYYPFPVDFVLANVAEMSVAVEGKFDVIVYTSSIEHMHKDTGLASLQQCRKLARKGTRLILTCPNTPEDQDGYDTQYRAHVYEWKRSELVDALAATGFTVEHEWGLLCPKTDLRALAVEAGYGDLFDNIARVVPTEWLVPVLAPAFPGIAKEIGFLCTTTA